MCFRGWKRLIFIKHPSFKGLKRPQHIFPLLYFFPPREISTLLFAELQLNLQKILLAISKKLAKAELQLFSKWKEMLIWIVDKQQSPLLGLKTLHRFTVLKLQYSSAIQVFLCDLLFQNYTQSK